MTNGGPSAAATANENARRAEDTDASQSVLRISDLTKSFRRGIWPRRRKVDVLRGASLTVEPAELVGLVGENGSGKSVLMQIVVGLMAHDSGAIERSGRLGYSKNDPRAPKEK